jgi:DNA (cytosine-5)-methyltransferase 1
LWWVADAGRQRDEHNGQQVARASGSDQSQEDQRQRLRADAGDGCSDGGVADAESERPSPDQFRQNRRDGQFLAGPGSGGNCRDDSTVSGMGNADEPRPQGHGRESDRLNNATGWEVAERRTWTTGTFIPCTDGTARRIEPSIFPLAHGIPNRVGTLRGAGNAIVPQVAAVFVRATGV